MKQWVGVRNVSDVSGARRGARGRGARGAVDAGWRDADVEARQTRDAPRVAPQGTRQADDDDAERRLAASSTRLFAVFT